MEGRLENGLFLSSYRRGPFRGCVLVKQTCKRQQDGAQVAGGWLLFVVQGQVPSNPTALRSITDVVQAVDLSVEQSLQKVDALVQHAQVLAQQQSQPVQDEPSRMHRMV